MAESGSSLRIALCFGTFPPERNGGSDFVARFADALAASCTVHVITSSESAAETERLPSGVMVHRIVDDWTIRRGRKALRHVNALLASNGVELTHVFFPESTLQARYQLPSLVGLGSTPLVTTWWNLGLGRRSPLPLRLTSMGLLARSRIVSSHDPAYLASLRRLVMRTKPVRWLPVGSNFSNVERTPTPKAAFTLGFFGQLDFTRGVDTLFEALALLGRRDLRLVMLGSAGRPERYAADKAAYAEFCRLRALPHQLGVDELVEWTEYLSDADVANMLATFDLCVLPYRRNSIGRSALAAAFGAGRPVILGGTPEGIVPLRSPEHVALVSPDDPVALAAEIGRLIDDRESLLRLSTGSRAAAEYFAWPRIAAQAIDLYREALR